MPRGVDRGLRLQDRRSGLERDAENQFLTVTDASLNTSRAIGRGAHCAVTIFEIVIVLAAFLQRAAKATAHFKSFGGG